MQQIDALAGLEIVGSRLIFAHNPLLTEIRLPSLEVVGGPLEMYGSLAPRSFGSPGLQNVSFGSLTRVGGDFRVAGEPNLRTLEVPALVEVERSLLLERLRDLAELDLRSLETIGDTFSFQYNITTLGTLRLPSLERVGEDFIVNYSSGVDALIVPVLEFVGGELRITHTSDLPECSAQALADEVDVVEGARVVFENDYLALCPEDTCTVQGDVIIEDEADLAELAQTGCTRIAGDLVIIDTELENLQGLENLRVVEGELFIQEIELLRSLEGLGNLEVAVRLWVEENPQLVDLVGLRSLQMTHRVSISQNESLVRFDGLERLESAGRLLVRNNDALVSIEALGPIRELHSLVISFNEMLASLEGLEELETVIGSGNSRQGSVIIQLNPSLTSLDGLDSLQTIRSRLVISDNDTLEDLSALFQLRQVRDSFIIVDNRSLATCEAFALLDAVSVFSNTHVRIVNNDDAGVCP